MIKRVQFWLKANRIGPDVLLTHWFFYFPSLSIWWCKKKFGQFGTGSSIRPGAYCVSVSHIFLGNNITVRPGSMFFADDASDNGSITIGDNVLIGSGVHIYVSTHKFSDPTKNIFHQGFEPSLGVVIESGCWVGANVIVLPGITIGENSVVGAGSIVTKDIPPRTLFAGNPARYIRDIK
jgi:acetyltransferase-like isoleucine patch superfamily enzyme